MQSCLEINKENIIVYCIKHFRCFTCNSFQIYIARQLHHETTATTTSQNAMCKIFCVNLIEGDCEILYFFPLEEQACNIKGI